MRPLGWVLLTCFASGLWAAEEAPVERVLSLSASIESAENNNSSLLAAAEDIRMARQRVVEAQGSLYPLVAFNGNASRYLGETYSVLPTDFGGTILPPSAELEADNYFSTRLLLKQTLYNGGRVRNNIRLAQAGLEQARLKHEELRAAVVLDTTRSFYGVLWARKERELEEAALAELSELRRSVAPGDVSLQGQLNSTVARLQRDLRQTQWEEDRATLSFLKTVGLELYTQVRLEGNLDTHVVVLDTPKWLGWARESRLELRGTDYQKEIDRLSVNLLEAERFPAVSFGAGYEFSDNRFPLRTTQWNTTLNINLPLFDGFASQARIRQRRYQLNQSRLERARVEDAIWAEVRSAATQVAFWQGELPRRAEDLRRAEQDAQALRSGDVQGRAQAVQWRVEARKAYWESVFEHRLGVSVLEKAVGRSLESGTR